MPEHFTANTVSAEFYCSKCGRCTQHRIDGHRKGPCLECIARLNAAHKPSIPATPARRLFDAPNILPLNIELWPVLWRERYEERAAIREFDAGYSRQIAEQLAEAEMRVRAEWSELT